MTEALKLMRDASTRSDHVRIHVRTSTATSATIAATRAPIIPCQEGNWRPSDDIVVGGYSQLKRLSDLEQGDEKVGAHFSKTSAEIVTSNMHVTDG